MTRFIVLAVVCAALAGTLPQVLERYQAINPKTRTTAAQSTPAAEPPQPTARASYLGGGRQVAIAAGASGHFAARFRINGQSVDGLVDTGATDVAMNESTARRLGVAPAANAYVYAVRTANGSTKAARVTLDSVEIGPIRVENVDALILDDRAISDTLIGMSFLSRLRSYAVEDGSLDLKG